MLKPTADKNVLNVTTMTEQARIRPVEKEASEWRFVAVTIFLVLIVTALPYVYAYLSTPPDKQFMGIMLDVPDHGQYFSWMRELTNANLSANKLTPEANKPVFFNLLWWGMGRLGRLLGISYAGMFQLLRIVSATLFLLLVYRLCTWFFTDRLMRRTAFLVVTFTSGFGWVLIVLKYTLTQGELLFPLDVFVAEGNTFLSILGYPHFIAAALYIFVFDLILRGQAKGRRRNAVAAGLAALFLGWQHAYDLVAVYGILAAYAFLLLLRDRRLPWYLIWSGLIVGLISWWPALYSVVLTSADPVWKAVLAQFANAGVYTPPLYRLPILLGPAFLLAIYTVIRDNLLRLKGIANNDLFLRGWFLVTFILVYLPVDYQIHLLNGWQVPIAFLATQGLFRYVLPFAERLSPRWQRRWSKDALRHRLAVGLILMILPTNLYLWLWRFVDLARHDYPFYLYKDDLRAMEWLEANAQSDDVVLSSLTIGQYIPALTGAHAFLAHWAQTLDFYGKSQMVDEFFDPNTDDLQRRQMLEQYSVDYVFYGPAERDLGHFDPGTSAWLVEVFDSSSTEVYALKH
jgi:hypothetical protein